MKTENEIYKWLADEIYDIIHKGGVDEVRKYWMIKEAYEEAEKMLSEI